MIRGSKRTCRTVTHQGSRIRKKGSDDLTDAGYRREPQDRMRLQIVIYHCVDKDQLIDPLRRVERDGRGYRATIRTTNKRCLSDPQAVHEPRNNASLRIDRVFEMTWFV